MIANLGLFLGGCTSPSIGTNSSGIGEADLSCPCLWQLQPSWNWLKLVLNINSGTKLDSEQETTWKYDRRDEKYKLGLNINSGELDNKQMLNFLSYVSYHPSHWASQPVRWESPLVGIKNHWWTQRIFFRLEFCNLGNAGFSIEKCFGLWGREHWPLDMGKRGSYSSAMKKSKK